MFGFAFRVMDRCPSLAWVAICRKSSATVEVLHGAGVEVAANWFCEAVWADTFSDGNFDELDLVFGSGARARSEYVTFVSSCTTLDRLHSFEMEGGAVISNSLACLLWFCNGRVDPNCTSHFLDFESVVDGIESYKQTLATSAGPIRLTYFDNLRWNGTSLEQVSKHGQVRDFGNFEKYRQFVDHSLALIARNMVAQNRRARLSMIGTMSSGYDSATTAALAQHHGLRDAFSFTTARGGDSDSGIRIADALGINLRLVDRDAWRAHQLPEVPFLATQASGGDVFFRGADEYLSNRVLLTGFHGDKVWGTEVWEGANRLARGDCSGTGLSEYRLSKGFIHVPLPFFAATQSTDIVRISQSSEMDPWRLRNSYDRPICRRVLEEAGVPRDAFGMTKKAVSVIFWQQGDFLTYESRRACRRYLRSRGVRFRSFSSSVADVLAFALRIIGRFANDFYDGVLKRAVRGRFSIINRIANTLLALGRGSDPIAPSSWMPLTTNDRMFRHVFSWATDTMIQTYAQSSQTMPNASQRRMPQ